MWEHASTFAGVNRELWPLARMTFLPALEQLTPGPVRIAMNDRRVAYDAQRRGVSFAEQEASLTPAGGRLEPEESASTRWRRRPRGRSQTVVRLWPAEAAARTSPCSSGKAVRRSPFRSQRKSFPSLPPSGE